MTIWFILALILAASAVTQFIRASRVTGSHPAAERWSRLLSASGAALWSATCLAHGLDAATMQHATGTMTVALGLSASLVSIAAFVAMVMAHVRDPNVGNG
jgi:hypothetical protein